MPDQRGSRDAPIDLTGEEESTPWRGQRRPVPSGVQIVDLDTEDDEGESSPAPDTSDSKSRPQKSRPSPGAVLSRRSIALPDSHERTAPRRKWSTGSAVLKRELPAPTQDVSMNGARKDNSGTDNNKASSNSRPGQGPSSSTSRQSREQEQSYLSSPKPARTSTAAASIPPASSTSAATTSVAPSGRSGGEAHGQPRQVRQPRQPGQARPDIVHGHGPIGKRSHPGGVAGANSGADRDQTQTTPDPSKASAGLALASRPGATSVSTSTSTSTSSGTSLPAASSSVSTPSTVANQCPHASQPSDSLAPGRAGGSGSELGAAGIVQPQQRVAVSSHVGTAAVAMGTSMSALPNESATRPALPHAGKRITHVARKSAPSGRPPGPYGPKSPHLPKRDVKPVSLQHAARTNGIAKEWPRALALSRSHKVESTDSVLTKVETHHDHDTPRDVVLSSVGTTSVNDGRSVMPSQAPPIPTPNPPPFIDLTIMESALEDVEASFRAGLRDFRIRHALLVRHLLARNRCSHERQFARNESKGELSIGYTTTIPQCALQPESPFANMKPIQTVIGAKHATKSTEIKITQEIFRHGVSKKGTVSYLSAPVTRFKSKAVDVPEFGEYTTIRENVLSENRRQLLYWPYFDDETLADIDQATLWDELEDFYDMKNENRPRHALQTVQCQLYRPFVEEYLTKINLTWADILFWLLAPEETITGIRAHANESVDTAFDLYVLDRSRHCQEDFDRHRAHWKEVFSKLPTSSSHNLMLSALVCDGFLKVCGLSLWHLARTTELARPPHSLAPAASDDEEATPADHYRATACRVCHVQDCLSHGELKEKVIDDDYKRLKVGDDVDRDEEDSCSEDEKVMYGEYSYNVNHKYIRKPFYPCVHEGTCEEAGENCRCMREKIHCEKSCGCALSCTKRFRGCSCRHTETSRRLCIAKTCICRKLNRECDADLCGPCGAAEVLDPVNRYDEDLRLTRCGNVQIQLNIPKKTYLATSEVHGFGLQVGEPVKDGDYLGEYKGEVITNGEGERRGTIYKYLKTNYLFRLNRLQEVDSTRAGNKLRFINNSDDAKIQNCGAHVMLCNTETRIGMFASKDLAVGTELYFRYGYPKEVTDHFWERGQAPPTKGKAAATKGAAAKKGTSATKRKVAAEDDGAGPADRGRKRAKLSSADQAEPLLPSSGRSDSQRRAQTEKARAAKALKASARKERPTDPRLAPSGSAEPRAEDLEDVAGGRLQNSMGARVRTRRVQYVLPDEEGNGDDDDEYDDDSEVEMDENDDADE